MALDTVPASMMGGNGTFKSPAEPIGSTSLNSLPPVASADSSERVGHGRWAEFRQLLLGSILGALFLVLAGLGLYWWRTSAVSPVQSFWAPVLKSADPVLFCVADQTEYTDIQLRDAAEPAHQSVLRDSLTAVIIDDIAPIVDMAGILRENGKTTPCAAKARQP